MLVHIIDYSSLIINVLYTIYLARLKIWSWSLGIIGAILLLVLFILNGSYSLVLLEVIYVIFFSYGWHKWHKHGTEGELKVIKWMKAKDYIRYACYLVALCIFFTLFNYLAFKYLKGSKDVVSTGILTGITFVAIVMTIEKFMENWIIWIISDLYFVVVMYQQGLFGQVIQNFIFFLTAVYGFYYWYKNAKTKE